MNSKPPCLTPAWIAAATLLLASAPLQTPAAPNAELAGAQTPPDASAPLAVHDAHTSPSPSTASSDDAKTVGDQLILQAAAQLERRDSVSTRLRYQMHLSGQRMYGLGSYWQKGTGDDLKVRLELQIAGQEANLLQVSNSRFLWVERRLPVGRTVTRLDLGQLRADAAVIGTGLDEIQPGNASWTSSPPDLIAHAGGLPSLLSSLSNSFTFLPPQTMRLASKSESGQQTTSIPFFAVVGHWRTDRLSKLLATDPASLNPKRVPPRLPEEVLILIGQADLFPYRLEYRKLETPIAANQSGAAIPYQLSGNPMVVLEFTDIAFDVPTDPGQFNYTPGDIEWSDRTAVVLERLRVAREQQVASRPASPLQ